jgi:hypothetical protein
MLKIPTLIKICPVEAELFLADGQTDRRTDTTKRIVAFRNFQMHQKLRY